MITVNVASDAMPAARRTGIRGSTKALPALVGSGSIDRHPGRGNGTQIDRHFYVILVKDDNLVCESLVGVSSAVRSNFMVIDVDRPPARAGHKTPCDGAEDREFSFNCFI